MEFSLYNKHKNKFDYSVDGVLKWSLSLDSKLLLAKKIMFKTHGIHVVFNEHYDHTSQLTGRYNEISGGYTGGEVDKYDYYELSYKPSYSLTNLSDVRDANIELINILRRLKINIRGTKSIIYDPYVFTTSGNFNHINDFYIKVGIVRNKRIDPILVNYQEYYEESTKKNWFDKLLSLVS